MPFARLALASLLGHKVTLRMEVMPQDKAGLVSIARMDYLPLDFL